MTLALLASAAILAAQVGAVIEQEQAADPIVQIGVYSYRADGSLMGSAYDTPPSLASTVYVSGSLCQMGGGSKPLPPSAAYAWRFKGTVLSTTPDEAVVQLEWQRVLDRGQAVAGPGTS